MNLIGTIRAVTKLGGAALSGGLTAFIGALAAFVGESAANILKPVFDYIWFDQENGYLKDYPERTNESIIKRLWRIWHD